MDNPLGALGYLVASFQQIEYDLGETLALLLRPCDGRFAGILASRLSFSKLVETIDAMMRIRITDDKIVSEFGEIAVEALKLEQERNKNIHSHYELMEWGATMRYERMKHLTKFKKGYTKLYETIEDDGPFQKIADANSALALRLLGFNETLFFRIASKEEIEMYLQP